MRAPALLLSVALTVGCTGATGSGDPEGSFIVDDSKADNFLSASAQEYILEGKSTVTIDASLATASADVRTEAAKKLIGGKQTAIAWFVTQYLVDKEPDEANHAFGGFGGIAKGGLWQDLDVTERADHITYDFTFKQLVAGDRELMSKLPIRIDAGKHVFDLEIGKPTNEELLGTADWYRTAPWSAWDPSKVSDAQKEKMTFSIEVERNSTDAYFDIAKLAADGVIDIDVFFGWDYWDNYHVKHSQAMFTWLQEQGFTAPVATFDALTKDSGPFTKDVTADGKPVRVEIRIYYGKTGTDTDPSTIDGAHMLQNIARDSLTKRDVVAYSGHSGPFYGFALADFRTLGLASNNWGIDDTEMRVMPLASKYQVVLANGCDSYQIGEAFLVNPNKAGKNIDVITTTSFSNAGTPSTAEEFIEMLVGVQDGTKDLHPEPIMHLLTQLDNDSVYAGMHTMYGVHGIDNDPKLHPFARPDKFGTSCSQNSDCGGIGNLCTNVGTAGKVCTAACASDPGCGTGYACKAVVDPATSTIFGKACAPTN